MAQGSFYKAYLGLGAMTARIPTKITGRTAEIVIIDDPLASDPPLAEGMGKLHDARMALKALAGASEKQKAYHLVNCGVMIGKLGDKHKTLIADLSVLLQGGLAEKALAHLDDWERHEAKEKARGKEAFDKGIAAASAKLREEMAKHNP